MWLISPHLSKAQSDINADSKTDSSCQQPLDCPLQQSNALSASLEELAAPNIVAPPTPTPSSIPARAGGTQHVTYDVTTRGSITADLQTFKTLAQQTYDDQRGWRRLGVSFSQVASGGNFTLVLASADQLPIFSSSCSSDYSCRVGRYVIINQDRWLGATTSWNNAGGSLRDYQHMVVNHETGHWLGHGHSQCGGAGQAAPVMQQQSINLQGCHFNPWPLNSELRSPALGL